MIRSLIKLAVVAIAIILVYNYFFGAPDEKATSQKIFSQIGQLAHSVRELALSEKDKFDRGKYNKALDKMSSILQSMKKDANSNQDQDRQQRIAELEKERDALEQKVNRSKSLSEDGDNAGAQKAPDRLREANDLFKQLESLRQEIETLTKDSTSQQ